MESTPAVKGQAPIVGSEVIFIHNSGYYGLDASASRHRGQSRRVAPSRRGEPAACRSAVRLGRERRQPRDRHL